MILGRLTRPAPALRSALFSAAIPSPESHLAGRPMLVVTFVFIQIVVTLILVGVLSPKPASRRRLT